jgi:hypothetical protein
MKQPKPTSQELTRQMLDTLQQLLDGWIADGVCPQCLSRILLLHAGLIAAHGFGKDGLGRAIKQIVESGGHSPSPNQVGLRA